MKTKSLFLSLILCVLCNTLQAADEPTTSTTQTEKAAPTTTTPSWSRFEDAFQAGVTNYQAKMFDQAREAFQKSLELSPNSTSALTNLALAQFQLGQKGMAIALLRKASALDPDFSTPKAALSFILPQMDVKEIPHEIRMWESLRSQLLVPVALSVFLSLTALFFFASGWLLLSFFGARKKAFKDEAPLPNFPVIATLVTVGFIAFLSLSVLKIWDHTIPRATVIAEKVSVLSAPDEKAPSLFELYSGLEVVIESVNQNWVQVTYPGAMTGWVPKSSLYHTTGRAPW